MTAEDLKMLNDYHKKTYEVIAPLVSQEVREWLKHYTRELNE